jgi:hypothetical protein
MTALKPTFCRLPPSTSVRSRRLTLAKDAAWVAVSCVSFRRARIAVPSWRALLIAGFICLCYVKGTNASTQPYCYIYVHAIRCVVKGCCVGARWKRYKCGCFQHIRRFLLELDAAVAGNLKELRYGGQEEDPKGLSHAR